MKIRFYLKWLVAIVFFLISIFGVLENPFESLMFLTLALFIAPLTHYQIINRGLNVEFSTKLKWIISIIIFITIGFIGVNNKTEIIDEQGNVELSDKRREVIEREKEIETLKLYLRNRSINDENGLSYNLSYEEKIIEKELVFESPIISLGLKSRKISSYKIKTEFSLFTNGLLIQKILIEGFIFNDIDIYGYTIEDICTTSWQIYPSLKTKEEIINEIESIT